MNSMKRQNNITLEDEPSQVRKCPICYWGKGEDNYDNNNSRKNEVAGPKWKWHSAVTMSGGESKVQCCKEQYCIGTWNIRSMNQGKLDMVKQEMTRVNIDILWISELKCMGMYGFNSDDHCIYYCEQESLRRNGVALMSTKESKTQYQNAISKTTEWSSSFPSKPFNITVIQVYAPTTNAEEAEVDWFYEDL